MFILRIHERRCDKEICGGLIVGNGDIIDLGDPEKGLDIRVMGLGRQRVGEKDHKVHPAFHDLCADLLVAAQGAAVIALDRKPGGIGDHPGGGAGAAEKVVL